MTYPKMQRALTTMILAQDPEKRALGKLAERKIAESMHAAKVASTKLPLWKLEQQLAAAQAKFERCETAYRQAERELWTARNAVDCRRAEVQT